MRPRPGMAVTKALSSPGERVPLALGAITAAWAVLSWLTTVPSADKLAEGIQVQRLLDHHAMVWSFPGQTHGGVLEYPIQLVLAWLSPGKRVPDRRPQISIAAASGYALALFALRLFPRLHTAILLAAAAAGPAWLTGGMWAELRVRFVLAPRSARLLRAHRAGCGRTNLADSGLHGRDPRRPRDLPARIGGAAGCGARCAGDHHSGGEAALVWLARTRRRAWCRPHRRGTDLSAPIRRVLARLLPRGQRPALPPGDGAQPSGGRLACSRDAECRRCERGPTHRQRSLLVSGDVRLHALRRCRCHAGSCRRHAPPTRDRQAPPCRCLAHGGAWRCSL